MYTSFEVKNFRGLKEFRIDNLELVNLIAGKNNAGKTTILEALFLYAGGVIPSLIFKINAFRGMEKVSLDKSPGSELPWDSLFYDYDASVVS